MPNQNKTIFDLFLVLFALLCAIGWFSRCVAEAHSQAPQHFSEDAEALARLRVHEAGWPSRTSPTNDGGMIGQVMMKRAARAHESVAAYIARVHHRHTTTSSRVWVRGLNRSMQRPEGWPESSVPWMRRGHDSWLRALEEAESVLTGEFAPCTEVPDTWGGTVDRARIERMVGSGNYRVVNCGRTLNTPLVRARR
jgi:hypothetical protein